jgi:hypothetical protein
MIHASGTYRMRAMLFVLLWIAIFAGPALAYGYSARRRRRAQQAQA